MILFKVSHYYYLTYPITLCLRISLLTPCRVILSFIVQAIVVLPYLYIISVYIHTHIPLCVYPDSYARGVDPKKVLEEDKANQIQHLTTFFNEVYIYYYYIYYVYYYTLYYYHKLLLCTIIIR